jgi:four helix bundle protein
VNYNEWQLSVPKDIREDSLWRMEAYRLALFVAELGWHDVTKLTGDKRTRDLSSQLYEALGSISANISEGYSRGTGRDRARFYEYALGSARESRGWYYKGRHILEERVVEHRIKLLTELIRLLLKTIPDQRGSLLKDESPDYHCSAGTEEPLLLTDELASVNLFENIPMK